MLLSHLAFIVGVLLIALGVCSAIAAYEYLFQWAETAPWTGSARKRVPPLRYRAGMAAALSGAGFVSLALGVYLLWWSL